MKTICLSLLVLTGALLGVRGEDYRTDINPALLYYQAFLLAPDPMSEADRDYFRSKEAKEKKLPERFGPIAAGYDNQFRLVRKAAHATVPCDWGVDLSAGPNAMLPHLARARAVVQAASFRAVWDLQHGNQDDARDDLLAAFVLARNVPQDGTLICTLAQDANEAVIYGTVAAMFGEFSPETLKQLADGFDRAPARHTVAACLPATKSIREWFVGKILELQKAYPNDDAKVMAGFRELAWMGDTNLWLQIVAASGGTSKGVLKLFDELESRYPRLAELMALPEPEFETQAKQFFADGHKSRNPFIVESVIAWEKARPVEFTIQAWQAMVRAAVEYKLHGEAGLKSVMDPFGNGPFAFQRFEFKGVDRGFELKSAYAGAGSPFVLIFVEKQGPAFQITGPNAGKEIVTQ
jgi:hypothetical protein